ncbi:hypothetical protein ABPG72_014376 [Tetrahymena utriculariae]
MINIQRSIKLNEKYQQAEQYSKKLEGISRITNWHETKVKYDNANQNKYARKMIDQEMKYALKEVKMVRNVKLKELYEQESKQWEQELSQKGLAIYKHKH